MTDVHESEKSTTGWQAANLCTWISDLYLTRDGTLDTADGTLIFRFEKRSRRPPLNSVNAMISFGNTLLYRYIANIIGQTSLSVKIGYLHSTNRRAESLNLDIAESYKPIIVDTVILSMIHTRMISPTEHFRKDGEGVVLTGDGIRIFIKEFNRKLNTRLMWEGESLTYRQIIHKDILNFQSYVNEKTPYIPFLYRN